MNVYNKVTGKKVGYCKKKGLNLLLFDNNNKEISPFVNDKGKVFPWTVDRVLSWGNQK